MKKLSIKDLADKLQIKTGTIYHWVSAKKIPYLKIEGTIRFDEGKIEKWLKEKEVEVV